MQSQNKQNAIVILLITWLIILGSYLFIRVAFVFFGPDLKSEVLGVFLAVIPYLLGSLYLWKCCNLQKTRLYTLSLLLPSIAEKTALYFIGAFLCGVNFTNIAGVMEAVASREPYVKLFTQPSARYAINLWFFDWTYIIYSIVFSVLCVAVLVKLIFHYFKKTYIQK